MEVLAAQVLERVQVAGGREARLGPGDVEPDHAVVAVRDGQLGDLAGPGGVPHRGDDRAHPDLLPLLGRGLLAVAEPGQYRLDDLLQRQPGVGVLLRSPPDLGVHDAVVGQVLDGLAGHAGQPLAAVCMTATVCANVSR